MPWWAWLVLGFVLLASELASPSGFYLLFAGMAAIIVATLIAVIASLMIAARLSDGPIAIFPGGPLESGELVTGPEPDWSFARDIDTVELELVTPPRSRTTWILEHERKIYVPCGYMKTPWGRLWKKWPLEAEADSRAIVRIEGKRYERQLVRITGPELSGVLMKEIQRKYGVSPARDSVESGDLWLFQLGPTG